MRPERIPLGDPLSGSGPISIDLSLFVPHVEDCGASVPA